MKNKKVVIILTSFVVLIGGILFANKIYNKSKNKHIPKRNNLAIMVKGESGDYVSSDAIPKGNYVLNEEKTICENGGKVVSYNNSTGQIGFSFLGSDRCSLYFDKIIDIEKPVISNLTINDTIITATLTDNIELSGYGISTSNSVEPTSWTSISGTTYNLSISITTEGTYYLWVKDSAENKIVSDVIDLVKYGWKTILANNTVNETTPNFSTVATTNEGLYKAEDDLGTSYYFRGAVNNNWVKFGKENGKDIYWRIIRINGDGSIRMIYSGTTKPNSSTATVMTGTGTQITVDNVNTFAFNGKYSNPAYAGYMYTANVHHGNSTSSTIKTAVDNWYKTTTLETDNSTKSLVADQIFCNDRSATTSTSGTPGEISGSMSISTTYYFGAYVRLRTNKTPKLTCTSESDKFTVNASNGNGALTYPVGLITSDEEVMAGGVFETINIYYYLYTNQYYWTGSPSFFNSGFTRTYGFLVYSSSYVAPDYGINSANGVRPVISLSSKAKLSGDGTWNNVYTVS